MISVPSRGSPLRLNPCLPSFDFLKGHHLNRLADQGGSHLGHLRGGIEGCHGKAMPLERQAVSARPAASALDVRARRQPLDEGGVKFRDIQVHRAAVKGSGIFVVVLDGLLLFVFRKRVRAHIRVLTCPSLIFINCSLSPVNLHATHLNRFTLAAPKYSLVRH